MAGSSFRCEKVKAKWAVLVTDLLSKEGVEASGGVSTGVGAGKSGGWVSECVCALRCSHQVGDVADREE